MKAKVDEGLKKILIMQSDEQRLFESLFWSNDDVKYSLVTALV